MFKKSIILLGMLSVSGLALAQAQVADKIVGVVGSKIILQSDVELQFENEKGNNPYLADSAKCAIVYNMLAQQILIEQADRDSVIVTDEEVEANLDQQVRYWINMAGGSKEALEKASGRTLYQMKEDSRQFFKDKAIADKMQGEIMKNIKITPSEVTAFFNQLPQDSLPKMPATVEIGQIVIKPDIAPEIDQLAKDKLEKIRKEIAEGGKSFSTMASIYSDDPGSRDQGGLITISRTGFDPQFVAAAYRLQPGEISPVIKSKFGYHIIKMERRMGDEAQVRHILIIPEVTTVDLDKTLKRMDSIRANLVSGKISFSEAVGKYSTDEQAKMTGGMIQSTNTGSTILQIDELKDPAVVSALSSLKVGEYGQPKVFSDPRTQGRACRILYLKSRTDPHQLNLKDDYNQIQQAALQKKQYEYLHNWVKERIGDYYIRIAPEYQGCYELRDWNLAANKAK
jgi:peptidyl-prolyl cis-trans isomerase SurA